MNTPRIEVGSPDAFWWRAGALLEQLVLLRPLPARNEYFAYGVAIAYIRASGDTVDSSYEPWRDLITDIRALRLTVLDVADRLRSMRPAWVSSRRLLVDAARCPYPSGRRQARSLSVPGP
ncbi:hypothetical protein [Streptomyces sp. MN13]